MLYLYKDILQIINSYNLKNVCVYKNNHNDVVKYLVSQGSVITTQITNN